MHEKGINVVVLLPCGKRERSLHEYYTLISSGWHGGLWAIDPTEINFSSHMPPECNRKREKRRKEGNLKNGMDWQRQEGGQYSQVQTRISYYQGRTVSS